MFQLLVQMVKKMEKKSMMRKEGKLAKRLRWLMWERNQNKKLATMNMNLVNLNRLMILNSMQRWNSHEIHIPNLKRKHETLPFWDEVHSKRSRVTSLLHEISNENLKSLNHLVKIKGLDIKVTRKFVLKIGHQLKNIMCIIYKVLWKECIWFMQRWNSVSIFLLLK
jgi:hypothetical protein